MPITFQQKIIADWLSAWEDRVTAYKKECQKGVKLDKDPGYWRMERTKSSIMLLFLKAQREVLLQSEQQS
jgi:hypothetical protein